jgi:hypothetical protein
MEPNDSSSVWALPALELIGRLFKITAGILKIFREIARKPGKKQNDW